MNISLSGELFLATLEVVWALSVVGGGIEAPDQSKGDQDGT